jgi:hypothetical protein
MNEWKTQLRDKIPPGYKDAAKEDTGIGDFLIWKALLKIGETQKTDLIFVTGEEKADWFVRSNKERIYPRPELVDEYRRKSGGRNIRLSSLHELLREMQAPEQVVDEVRSAEYANNAIIRASSEAHQPVISFGSRHQSIIIADAEFDYSTNNGLIQIEHRGMLFQLKFSKADNRSIHLCRTGGLRRIARVKRAVPGEIIDVDRYDSSSDHYTIRLDEVFYAENLSSEILVGRIVLIEDDTRVAEKDGVLFVYSSFRSGETIVAP